MLEPKDQFSSMSPAVTSVLPQENEKTNIQENDFGVDNFLLTALENPRDRLTILKLDQELEAFVKDTNRTRLDFPPTSSYQRLIVHRVAQYFKLDHVVLDVEGGKRAVVLFKTSESRVPVLRFVDLIEQPEGPPAKAVKIMRRGQLDMKKPHLGNSIRNRNSSSGKDRTLEEREEEYAKARARIFGKGNKEDLELEKVQPNPNDISSEQISTVQKVPVVQPKEEREENKIRTSPHITRPILSDSMDYIRSTEPNNWNRLWNPTVTNSMDSLYNYEYYDVNLLNYRNAYAPNWSETNSNMSVYSNYLTSPTTPLPTDFANQVQTPFASLPTKHKSPLPPTKAIKTPKSDIQEKKVTDNNRVAQRKSSSPPSTPSYYPTTTRTPPPIIYTYPNEDMWSFYGSGVLPFGNPVAYSMMGSSEAQVNPYLNYYDYDRRPPKSTELFDPNAPTIEKQKTNRPYSMGMLDDMRQMQNFPRSPSHDSFFQFSQQTCNPNSKVKITEPQVHSDQKLPNSTKSNSTETVPVGATQLGHILEISGLPRESTEVISEIEQSGAVIKWLDNDVGVAIYKTANAAKDALARFDGSCGFSLRPWKVPLTPPANQLANLSIQ